ncbi:hypothetical protein RvY_18052 [Ramazzottius varieornatus]|uniref:Uncharacterized protein n=1 Tax=Ramazzottius varieornatus TaxID=947166 RepID=A0A1D1W4D2_RAMVA|nr:hypothetical protein RvY_18052 [Ramazzottius varieornatus]
MSTLAANATIAPSDRQVLQSSLWHFQVPRRLHRQKGVDTGVSYSLARNAPHSSHGAGAPSSLGLNEPELCKTSTGSVTDGLGGGEHAGFHVTFSRIARRVFLGRYEEARRGLRLFLRNLSTERPRSGT